MELGKIGLVCLLLLMGFSGDGDNERTKSTAAANNTRDQLLAKSGVIRLSREETFAGGDTSAASIADVAVDDSGRVFVADRRNAVIDIYAPDGTKRAALGNQGRRGEFNVISSIKIDSGQLYVVEAFPRPYSITVFSLETLSHTHTINLAAEHICRFRELKGYSPDEFYPVDVDKILVAYTKPYLRRVPDTRFVRYYYQNGNGRIVSPKIFEQKGKTYFPYRNMGEELSGFRLPFQRESLFTVSDNGFMYSAWTGDFRIQVLNMEGEHLREIKKPMDKKPLNVFDLVVDDGDDLAKLPVAKRVLPDTWPALESLITDDKDRLWVSTIVEDMRVYKWWIVSSIGEVLGTFRWPRDRSVRVIKNNHLYTIEPHEETAGQQVVRYNLVL